jgi:hypothetical protein
MRALLIFAIVASSALAHAQATPPGTAMSAPGVVFPTELPPMYYVDGAATAAASVTTNIRAISAQYDFSENNLFAIGGAGVIDESWNTYSLQVHMALGRRFTVFHRPIMGTGNMRVGIDLRVLAEGVITQPGKDDTDEFRFAFDGGVGAWAVTPKGVHLGMHVGPEIPFSNPASRPAELAIAAMIGMPYGEPDPHAAQNDTIAVDKMLTTDPKTWPPGAYNAGAAVDHDVTIVSIGVILAVPVASSGADGTMPATPADSRLMLAVGVLYP